LARVLQEINSLGNETVAENPDPSNQRETEVAQPVQTRVAPDLHVPTPRAEGAGELNGAMQAHAATVTGEKRDATLFTLPTTLEEVVNEVNETPSEAISSQSTTENVSVAPQFAYLLAGALPVNLAALERKVDQLFMTIESVGEQLTAQRPSLQPAFLLATGALVVTAYELARLRKMKARGIPSRTSSSLHPDDILSLQPEELP
jgi:hypothetical protein